MRRRHALAALLALDAVLAAALLWNVLQPPAAPPIVAARPLPPDPATGSAAYVPPALAEFAEIGARPLFVASRRPIAKVALAPAPPQPVTALRPLQVVVLGVIVSEERRLALLRIDNAAQSRIAAEGDEIDGWKIVSITAQTVVMRGNGSEREIGVQKSPPPAAGGRAVPPPLPRR